MSPLILLIRERLEDVRALAPMSSAAGTASRLTHDLEANTAWIIAIHPFTGVHVDDLISAFALRVLMSFGFKGGKGAGCAGRLEAPTELTLVQYADPMVQTVKWA